MVVLAIAPVPAPTQVPSRQTDTPVFSIDSQLVVLQVSVLDGDGAFVAGLDRHAFRVYEDGRRQPIALFLREEQSVTVGLAIDASLSMWQKREPVLAAILAFARSGNPRDELFTVSFNERVAFGLPPDTPFTNDPHVLQNALERVGARGQTALYDAVLAALRHLEGGHMAKRVLILVSDGGDNASRAKKDEVVDLVRRTESVVYTIALFGRDDRDANPDLLRELARASGGQMFHPRSAEQSSEVLERISRDIRRRYTIGYTPTNTARDGRFRTVQVIVDAPNHDRLVVRTRPGYYARSDSDSSSANRTMQPRTALGPALLPAMSSVSLWPHFPVPQSRVSR